MTADAKQKNTRKQPLALSSARSTMTETKCTNTSLRVTSLTVRRAEQARLQVHNQSVQLLNLLVKSVPLRCELVDVLQRVTYDTCEVTRKHARALDCWPVIVQTNNKINCTGQPLHLRAHRQLCIPRARQSFQLRSLRGRGAHAQCHRPLLRGGSSGRLGPRGASGLTLAAFAAVLV